MEANQSVWQKKYVLLNDYHKRLHRWGSDTGASTRSLDRALRQSSALREQTITLLEEFNTALQESMCSDRRFCSTCPCRVQHYTPVRALGPV